MLRSALMRIWQAGLALETIFGVIILLGLISYGIYQHPTSVTDGSYSILITAFGLLIAYGMVALWNRQHPSDALRAALGIGAAVGLILGTAGIVNISIEYSGAVNQAVRGITGPAAMGLMATLFGATGSITYQRTGSLKMAVWSGIWCAMISSLVTCIFGFSYCLGFMSSMEQITYPEFVRSGMQDPQGFVIRNTLESASSHLLIAPLMAAFFSCSGALISARLRSAQRSAAIVLAVVGIFQLLLSVGAIHFALSLARSQRPVFIVPGMLAGGIALTYVYPALSVFLGRQIHKVGIEYESSVKRVI